MRQRILGSHTPPCHQCMVITTQFSVLPCYTVAQTSFVPLQVAFDWIPGGGGSLKGLVHNLLMQFLTRAATKRKFPKLI